MDVLFPTQCQSGLAGGHREKGGPGLKPWRRYIPSAPRWGLFAVQQGFNRIFPLISFCSCKKQRDLPCSPLRFLQTCPAPGHKAARMCVFNIAALGTSVNIRGIA